MNIGLCGSHRTGKTTLAELISRKIGATFVKTRTSGVFEEHGMDPSIAITFPERLWIQKKVLEAAEKIWAAEQRQFVTDRTPLDMAAYTLADIQGLTDTDFIELGKYLSRCFEVTNRFFGLLVLLQPGIPLVHEAGKAALNEGYLEHLNYLILGLCHDERILSTFLCLPRNIKGLEDRSHIIMDTYKKSCL